MSSAEKIPYAKTEKGREAARKASARYYERHKDERREIRLASAKAYYAKNRDKINARRRAQKAAERAARTAQPVTSGAVKETSA
jgi:hypothetical protein